ncbi:MAG: hypothetical protein ACI8W8_001471 [Rhodothermales bacterium]|jgi:hypothetical protein
MGDSPEASAFLTTQWSVVLHAGVGAGHRPTDRLYKYTHRSEQRLLRGLGPHTGILCHGQADMTQIMHLRRAIEEFGLG